MLLAYLPFSVIVFSSFFANAQTASTVEKPTVVFEKGVTYNFGAVIYAFTRASYPSIPEDFCKKILEEKLQGVKTDAKLEEFSVEVNYQGNNYFSCSATYIGNSVDNLGDLLNGI